MIPAAAAAAEEFFSRDIDRSSIDSTVDTSDDAAPSSAFRSFATEVSLDDERASRLRRRFLSRSVD